MKTSAKYGASLAAFFALACGGEGSMPLDGAVDGATSFVGVRHCTGDSECDDRLDCTADTCVDQPGEGRVCHWTIAPGRCLLDGACWNQGDARPGETCAMCNAATPTVWSGEGMVCDDGDACTFMTTCEGGACLGTVLNCDDGFACTADACDPAVGCLNQPVGDGLSCDDGDVCTTADSCAAGECTGTPVDCDDDNPCTDDTCDGAGACVHTNSTAACEDGDPCTVSEMCSAGSCGGGVPNTCNDRNGCTIDVCDAVAGCYHLPTQSPCCTGMVSICEDFNPCTDDLCDPSTAACSRMANTEPCDDGNACTVGDMCGASVCRAGTPRNCSDGNDCTLDLCSPASGCVTPRPPATDGSTCSDSMSCSTGDHCMTGVCTADTTACGCTPVFQDAAKVRSILIGMNEMPGEALDVNGDGTLDNALSAIEGFVNPPLGMAVMDGSLIMLFEYLGFMPGPFTLALLTGELDPANSACDYQNARCNYWADRSSLVPVTCARTISLSAVRSGTLVTAGSPTTSVPLTIPVGTGGSLNLTIYMVNLQMTVTLTTGQVTGFTALLGGAVRETDLNTAIRALPPGSLPLTADALISLLMTVAPNDIDTNGDGTLDAKSIGLKLAGIDGALTGVASP